MLRLFKEQTISHNNNLGMGEFQTDGKCASNSDPFKTQCPHCHKMISRRNISTHLKTCKVKKNNETDQSLGALLEKVQNMEREREHSNDLIDSYKRTILSKDLQISTLQDTLDKLLQNVVIIKKDNGTLEVI